MELFKIFGVISGIIFILCFFTGCFKSMEPIDDSDSYFIKNNKIIYSYHKSNFIMGEGEVKGADLETFIPVNDEYAYDKNSIYWNEFVINGADKDSFKIFGKNYSKDKNMIYYKQNPLIEADIDSFKLGGNFEAEDIKYYYKNGNVLYLRKDIDK